MSERPSTTLPGTVEKIVKSPVPSKPDKAHIAVEGAEDEHKKISIENSLTDKNGEEVCLKPGAKVDVTIKAEIEAIHFGRHSG